MTGSMQKQRASVAACSTGCVLEATSNMQKQHDKQHANWSTCQVFHGDPPLGPTRAGTREKPAGWPEGLRSVALLNLINMSLIDTAPILPCLPMAHACRHIHYHRH